MRCFSVLRAENFGRSRTCYVPARIFIKMFGSLTPVPTMTNRRALLDPAGEELRVTQQRLLGLVAPARDGCWAPAQAPGGIPGALGTRVVRPSLRADIVRWGSKDPGFADNKICLVVITASDHQTHTAPHSGAA